MPGEDALRSAPSVGGESLSARTFSTPYLFSRITTVFLMVAILFSVPAGAQVAGGTLSGTITDPSDREIPQAQVAITNVATGVTTTVTTNTDGYFTVPNLRPGEYEVTVSAKGFSTESRTGISLTVGSQQVFNLVLKVGSAAKTVVEVTTEAPAVQLASSDISAVVNATTVRELPLNGRSWTDLAALQPGVSTIQTQPGFQTGSDRGNRGFGQQLTISGARPQQNNYRLDGVSLNDYANGAPGSVLGGNLGVDAIQEFSVLTSNYSAEYGKTSGGVVNAITRSGTNAVHGSVYEFLRNSALDAKNYFEQDPTLGKAAFKRNQFGGAIGGPIIKNRTFFFADYEGIRQSKGIPNKLFVPSVASRNSVTDPIILKYLALYPLPLSTDTCSPDTCQHTFTGQQVVNENFITTRIDHRFSDKDALSGTYLYDKTPYNSPDSFGNVGLTTLSSRQIVAVEENHTFTPTILNAIRFGYNHEKVDNDATAKAINMAANDPSLGVFPNRDASVVIVSGGVLTQMNGGVGGLPTYFYRWNSYQLYDDAFVNRGTHTIKFGFAAERLQLYAVAQTDPNGVWTFPDLPSFLQNKPSKFAGGDIRTATPRNFRQSIFGGYVQDDWRWKPNLTVNMGLRYEMATVMTETAGKIVNLRTISDQFPVCGALDPGGFCSGKGPLFLSNPTLYNVEPRIGFAWDPRHNGRMAVRGGIGLFDVLPLPYQFILSETQATPFFTYLSLNGTHADGTTPLSIAQLPPGDYGSNKRRSSFIESNPKRNYVMQWNLNMQYQLTSNLAALVAYVGSRGIHQPFKVEEADLTYPTLVKGVGYVWPAPPADPINPHYSSIKGMFYDGHSYYDALELQLAKRMSHGLQMQGTFTWSKSIDTSSATLAGDSFGTSISSLDYFDLRLSRGPSDFNVPRLLVINGTWEVPTPKSWTGAKHWLAGGWELGTIFTVSDGVPFTPTYGTGGDPANTSSSDDFAFPNRVKGVNNCTNPGNPVNYINSACFALPTLPDPVLWNQYCDKAPANLTAPITDPANPPLTPSGNPLPPFVCFNLRGNSGRNILKGPGVMDLDFSIFKNNRVKRISENFNVQFRVEMFNILNHPNFAPPGPGDGNTDVFSAAGDPQAAGQLFRTTIPERQIQFAVKVIF
jgi:hypothetical protein